MKMKRYLITLTLFMVLMCCVSAISAASDDAINNTMSEMDFSDEAISVSNDENTVTEIDSGDEAISSSNGEQAIGVDESDSALNANENDDVIGHNQEGEKLSDSITIDGVTYNQVIENRIIDTDDYVNEEFYIDTNTFINNCTFLCGEDEYNYISTDYNLNILINNSSIYCGLINSENGILKIENSTINKYINNWEGSTLIISDDTQFSENLVIRGTGTIIINDTTRLLPHVSIFNVTDYTFENHTFNDQIINYGNLTLINPIMGDLFWNFENYGNIRIVNITSTAWDCFVIQNYEGATLTIENSILNTQIINSGTLIISDDTEFGNNFKISGSGTIIINDTAKIIPYLTSLYGTHILENYTFTKNMYNYGDLTLINTVFNAVLFNYGNLTIINSTFEDNSHKVINNGFSTEINCNFTNAGCSATNLINCNFIDGTCTGTNIINCTFIRSDCTANNGLVENCSFVNNSNGALRIDNGTVKNSIFKNNGVTTTSTSVSGGASGGAIYSNKNLIVDNCTFEDNYAKSSSTWIDYQGGGAIYAALDLTVTNSKFINNYVEAPHGTVVSNDHYYEIVESGMGGAILVGKLYNTERNVVIVNNSFEGNKASIDGSAIYIKAGSEKTNITIVANNFTGNSEGQDTIFIRNYEEVVSSEGNYLKYENATTEITNNNYLSNSMNYKTFDLTGPEEIYAGETADIKLEIELAHPEFYDADIMERCNYTWYVNGELITNKETEMSVQITGNYITYVTPSISNQRTKVLSIIPTVLTDIIITPENINSYLFEGELIVSPKSHLIFQGDFENIGKIYNKKNDVIFDGENATFTNTTIKIEADKNTVKNMNIKNTDTSNYTIIVSGTKNKVINNTISQYNHDDQTAAIYNGNGEDTIISGNVINVTGPSLSITWTDGANTANTQGILSVGGANNIISYNNITVQNSTDSELALFSTMEAITAPLGENITITRNNVYVTGGRFNYGINTLTNVINNRITENNITVVGYRYTDGIQVGDGAVNNTIANNNIYLTCINSTPVDEAAISYGIIISSQGGTTSDNNTISENNIVIDGIVNYGMEIYTSTNTLITGNNITMNGAKSMGIGYAHSPNSTVIGNIIRINDDSTIRINSVTEEIQPKSVGIRIQQESDNITVTDNIIITNDKAKTDYTIDTVDKNTVITDNKLISSTGYGDETIKTTQEDTVMSDNIIGTVTEAIDVEGIVGSEVVLEANVATEVGTPVNGGTVEFATADGNVLGQANVVNGIAKVTATFNETIDTTLIVTYTPANAGLIASQANCTLKIGNKYPVEFTKAKGHPGRVDQNATIDVILSESDATGTVYIIVNGTDYSAELVDGAAVIYAPLLPAGVYSFDVIYSGDYKYENNTAPITFNVNKYYPTMKATADDVQVDENAIVNVALPSDATGTVTITVDGVDCTADVVDGTAAVELPVISQAGAQAFTVSYSGDDKYRVQTTTAKFNVNQYDASIKATARTVKLGNNVTVNVVLPSDATGDVSIAINDTVYTGTVEDGAAAIVIPDLGIGSYALPVEYSGDGKYGPANTTVTFNVNKQTTSMKATARTVKVGDDVTVNVALASDATGEVSIDVNGTVYTAEVADGTASIVIPDLPYGQYAFDVVYGGDDKYKTRTAKVTFNVNKYATSMKATARTVKVGDDVTVNVALASDATGDVIITIDGVDYNATVADGIASVVLSNLPAGQYSLGVKYSGDDKYKNQSTTVKFNVNKYSVRMKATAKYYADGDYAIVSTTLSDDATGNVTVEVNGKSYIANVVDGSALIAIPKLAAGNYTLDVKYSGDAKYKEYSVQKTLNVNK